MANPYHVERSWPDHFLEHRTRTVERQSMLVDDGSPTTATRWSS